jgi:hypothetical protein
MSLLLIPLLLTPLNYINKLRQLLLPLKLFKKTVLLLLLITLIILTLINTNFNLS